jgi:hypothetical protein
MDLTTLSKDVAREIIERVGSSGQPPNMVFNFLRLFWIVACKSWKKNTFLHTYENLMVKLLR